MTKDSKKILWLASYPKSGNTWFRAFLTALMNNGVVDINRLAYNDVFSSRTIFDYLSDLDSTYLYDTEVKCMLPRIYRQIAINSEKLKIIKAHDAYVRNEEGHTIFPEDVTYGAIYFIRNPLDIVPSLSSHTNLSVDETVNFLNNPNAAFAAQENNLNKVTQIRQYLGDWSMHVNSWMENAPGIPILAVRYEDMLTDTFNVFQKALNFMGWNDYTDDEIKKAIKASSFEQLKKQEEEHSFIEQVSYRDNRKFFRSGSFGQWQKSLTKKQVNALTDKHLHNLTKFGYL